MPLIAREERLRAGGVVAPLFVPALDERKLHKAWALAEAVIIDLEDAVADHRKSEAREWVRTLAGRKELTWVRVNAADTGRCRDDILAVAANAAVIVLPKCQSADDVILALSALDASGSGALLLPIIETAAGLEAAPAVARAAPGRMARLSLGLGDLSRDLGIPWEPGGPMAQHARCHVGIISRAAGLPAPIDTVVPTVGNVRMLEEDTARARAAGFGGKFCIHPTQVPVVQAGFRPSEAESLLARRQVLAFVDAIRRGGAAVVVDGYFVDYPVAELAEALLARAGQATGLLPDRDKLPGSGTPASSK